jgi:hypothetical protein
VSDAQAITKRPATAVILTALQLEIKAVTAHLQNIYESRMAHIIYMTAEISLQTDGAGALQY